MAEIAHAPAVAAVKNLRATPGHGQVTLEWDEPLGNATHYKIHQALNGNRDELQFVMSVTTLRAVVTRLENQPYEFWVTAYNAYGVDSGPVIVKCTPVATGDWKDAGHG